MGADKAYLGILQIATGLTVVSPLPDKLVIVTNRDGLRRLAHAERGLAVTHL